MGLATFVFIASCLIGVIIGVPFGAFLASVVPRVLFNQSLAEFVAELDDEVTAPDTRWTRIAISMDIVLDVLGITILGFSITDAFGLLPAFDNSEIPLGNFLGVLVDILLVTGGMYAFTEYAHWRAAGNTRRPADSVRSRA
jgi:large-conductance mechanosensitive channel